MHAAIILGSAKESMQLRLEEALKRDYDKIIIAGTPEEMHCLDDRLNYLNSACYESYSTWGNYVAVCDKTEPNDKLTFIGHESHTRRMREYKSYFSDRNIENIVLPDPDLKPTYRVFDLISASIHSLALRYLPGTMLIQARNRNSCLNRYIIPIKDWIMKRIAEPN